MCSQADDDGHRVEAFPMRGNADETLAAIVRLLESWPRTKVVAREGLLVKAECRTRLLRFTDDVTFLVDEDAGCVHVRSASRVGYSDLGANRKRVEALRTAWLAGR
ncbi:MAG: DUF1499 domain-containing protein [Planctomycetes bacterium]|nr:DUF1499 domain-containing protein [Planctomycetota bacterium]